MSFEVPSYPGDSKIPFGGAEGIATIHFGADPSVSKDVLTVCLPAEVTVNVLPHYHPKSTEWMKVLEGEVEGVVDGKKIVMRPGEDWMEIPAGIVHSFFKRGGKEGKKTIWLERAGPDPDRKKRFFEDAFDRGELPGLVGMMAVFYREGDSIPSMPGGFLTTPIEYALVYLIGGLAHHTGLAPPNIKNKTN